MTTKQHPPEKDAKHHDKPAEKQHKEEPKRAPDRDPPKQRVMMKSQGGDEVVVTHGTESYHVPRDGVIDLPPKVAEHVIRQGGAQPLDPPPDPLEGTTVVQNSDPEALLAYGADIYKPGRDGTVSIPTAIVDDAGAHGFFPVVEEDSKHGSRGK